MIINRGLSVMINKDDKKINGEFNKHLQVQLDDIRKSGMFKDERIIASPQSAQITLENGAKVLNFCANNYLGLSNHPKLIEYAKKHVDDYGFGVSSVRFICGTQTVHCKLEQEISKFLQMPDTILFPSCFDANGGVFESLLTKEDAIISDQLNHASIIDGVRLCKAMRYRYANNNMEQLEQNLQQADADGARFKLIVTDGVFSMDGIIANLKGVCDLADKYNALVMVDDSHATGFVGTNGRGTHEYCEVMGRVDIITSTLGKALGGASGGFVSASKNIVAMLKQKARPYLFSNSVAPVIAATSIKVLELVSADNSLREKLQANSKRFRAGLEKAGFDLIPGEHPIIPVMLYDEKVAAQFAQKLLEHGIYVIAFSYPVVPKGVARIRTQISSGHSFEQIDQAIKAFTDVGKELAVI